jgi:hypothetical protein
MKQKSERWYEPFRQSIIMLSRKLQQRSDRRGILSATTILIRHDCPCDTACHFREVTPLCGSRLISRYLVLRMKRGRCMVGGCACLGRCDRHQSLFISARRSSFNLFGHRPRQDRHLIEQRLAAAAGWRVTGPYSKAM